MSWLRIQMAVLDAASLLVSFATNWLLQSTLLIVAGLALAWLLRRRGSALQSAIYRTTLAAVIVCPLASGLLARAGVAGWSMPMPPAWTYEESSVPVVASAEPAGATAVARAQTPQRSADEAMLAQARRARTEVSFASGPRRASTSYLPTESAGIGPVPGQMPAPEPAARSGVAPSVRTVAAPLARFHVRAFGLAAIAIALIWLSASAWLLLRLGRAWRRLNRLCEEAVPAEPAVQEVCREVTALLDVAAPTLLRSPYLASPCMVGWPRAAVLLPEADAALPLRDVLIHELAHLRRGDAGWKLLGRLGEALFFYQPLLWLLDRRLESSAEDVCDDYVVQFGGDRSQYARGLLEIAELSTAPVAATAVAIVSLRSILAKRVIRIMDPSRSLSTRAGNLLLAVVIAGGLIATMVAGFVGLPQPSAEAQPMPDEKPKASEHVAEAQAKTTADNVAQPADPLAGAAGPASAADDVVTVSGSVVDPQGKPFAGAKVYAVRWYWEPHIPHPPLAETISDAGGRFTIAYRKSQPTVGVGRTEEWKDVAIVATADGFGPGWVTWRKLPRGEEATLRLVADDVPIAGRVVDLQGKPVAGVAVRVGDIDTGRGGNLDGWLAAVRRGEFPWTAVEHLDYMDSLPQFDGWPPLVVTGDDGRFRIDGLGRERLVELSFAGPTIAYQHVQAVTRRSEMFPLKLSRSEKGFDTVYGAEFELAAAPTQPITGIVRDAETHQPLAGVSIESDMVAGSSFPITRQSRAVAVSVENGRYRLVGMPKGAGNRLLAVPNDDQPYLMRDVKVPESRGLEPVSLDIDLHRGIWITGRVTDRATGQPLVATMHYLPFRSNEYARKTPEFGEPGSANNFAGRYVSRPDGSYRLVGVPGRAIVGAEYTLGHYREGVGADNIAGMDEHGHFDTYPNPVFPGKTWPNAMQEINPSPGTETVVCDLALDPGEKVTVNVVDRDGKPVDGFETQGSGRAWIWSPSHDLDASFDVVALGPDETRTVIVRHKERKLGKVVRVRLADHPSRSVTVTLDPAARIIGRLLDGQATPIRGAAIEASLKPTGDFSQRLPPTATDEQGRFDYSAVPTGCHYLLRADAAGMTPDGRPVAEDVAVEPGETKDLGDVVYGGALEANKNADAADAKTVRGRLTRRGKPAGGAHVAVIARSMATRRGGDLDWGHEVLAEATADEKGECVLQLVGVSQKTHAYANLVARQEGSAIAWRQLNLDAPETEVALELPDEVPVRGKLIEVEGQPASGVRMSIVSVIERSNSEKGGSGAGYRGDKVPAAWFAPIASDAEGRFVIHGVAANHGVILQIAGDDRFAQQDIALNTGWPEQRGEHDGTYRPLVKNAKPGEEAVLTLAPAQMFEGIVKYADTGEPVPGARLTIWASQQEEYGSMMSVAGRADEKGHYRISPRPGIRFGLTAYPPAGAPYLAWQTTLDRAIRWEGSERVKQVDLTLPRGVLVRGKVVEAGSGAPVAGAAIQYVPESSNNRNASDDILTGSQGIELTDKDGRFALAVLPGPGRLLVNGPKGNYAFQEIGDRQLSQGQPGGVRHYIHALATLNPQAGQEPLEIKLELQPGATVRGRVVDEAGNAVDEVLVISRLDISPRSLYWRADGTPTLGGRFELSGLADGVEYPVYFLDARRRLGATQVVKAGDSEITVVLKPCGKATLRAIDKGEPMSGYGSVEMVVTPGAARFDFDAIERGDLAADADFIANVDRTNSWHTSDDEGRLKMPALIPGASYRALAMRDGKWKVVKEFQVKANETLDLGDLVVQSP